ncbi:hypothetical protein [Alkalihalobacillus sp. R86527]|uniref:hypothetical protein n=1 Tax=Alkalihalobacillus sp. R86527 TaxID=3093863 RepID=UPI003671EAB3
MQIGKINLSEQLVWVGICVAIALLSIYLVGKFLKLSTNAADLAFETVVAFILFWKGSLLILSPLLVFNSPLSLLYFTGGHPGFILALLFTIIYFHWKLSNYQNHKNQIFLLSFGLVIGTFFYEIVQFAEEGSLGILLLLLAMLLLMVYWKSYNWRFLDVLLGGSILLFIIGMMRQEYMLETSKLQWLYLFVAIYIVWIQYGVYRRRMR